MNIINHSRIDINGIAYYFTREIAGYDMYKGIDGNTALVDENGHVTHSSLADILAWKDAKRYSQEETMKETCNKAFNNGFIEGKSGRE